MTDRYSPTNPSGRMDGEAYKDYAARLCGMYRAALSDLQALREQLSVHGRRYDELAAAARVLVRTPTSELPLAVEDAGLRLADVLADHDQQGWRGDRDQPQPEPGPATTEFPVRQEVNRP